MKRRDFLKAGLIPIVLPSSAKADLVGVSALGFKQKDGVCYGFCREHNGEVELLILDYQRFRAPHWKLDNIREHVDFSKLETRKKWGRGPLEYYANEETIHRLTDLLKLAQKRKRIPDTDQEAAAGMANAELRLPYWAEWLVKNFRRKK